MVVIHIQSKPPRKTDQLDLSCFHIKRYLRELFFGVADLSPTAKWCLLSVVFLCSFIFWGFLVWRSDTALPNLGEKREEPWYLYIYIYILNRFYDWISLKQTKTIWLRTVTRWIKNKKLVKDKNTLNTDISPERQSYLLFFFSDPFLKITCHYPSGISLVSISSNFLK